MKPIQSHDNEGCLGNLLRRHPRFLILLLAIVYAFLLICVAANMPLHKVKLLNWLPLPGQGQVIASHDLEAGRELTLDDLDVAQSFRRPDVFEDTAQLVNAYTAQAIGKGQPITYDQVARYQVVTKQKLDAGHIMTADDLELGLTPYRTQAYTDIGEVTGLRTRQPITQGVVILSSEFAYHVVAKDGLDPGATIAKADVAEVFVGEGKDKNKGDFVDTAQVVGLVVSGTIKSGQPILKNQVQIAMQELERCGIAKRALPAYHQIITDDLETAQVCSSVNEGLLERYTLKPYEKGEAIAQEDLGRFPSDLNPPLAQRVAIPFTVPAATAFGGQLKTGDVVDIFLVQGSEDVTPTSVLPITHALILSVTETGAGESDGEGAPPQESRLLIVAAIPKAKEQEFVRWLPFSEVVLSVATD